MFGLQVSPYLPFPYGQYALNPFSPIFPPAQHLPHCPLHIPPVQPGCSCHPSPLIIPPLLTPALVQAILANTPLPAAPPVPAPAANPEQPPRSAFVKVTRKEPTPEPETPPAAPTKKKKVSFSDAASETYLNLLQHKAWKDLGFDFQYDPQAERVFQVSIQHLKEEQGLTQEFADEVIQLAECIKKPSETIEEITKKFIALDEKFRYGTGKYLAYLCGLVSVLFEVEMKKEKLTQKLRDRARIINDKACRRITLATLHKPHRLKEQGDLQRLLDIHFKEIGVDFSTKKKRLSNNSSNEKK